MKRSPEHLNREDRENIEQEAVQPDLQEEGAGMILNQFENDIEKVQTPLRFQFAPVDREHINEIFATLKI